MNLRPSESFEFLWPLLEYLLWLMTRHFVGCMGNLVFNPFPFFNLGLKGVNDDRIFRRPVYIGFMNKFADLLMAQK